MLFQDTQEQEKETKMVGTRFKSEIRGGFKNIQKRIYA